jgi:hypothetical protein
MKKGTQVNGEKRNIYLKKEKEKKDSWE